MHIILVDREAGDAAAHARTVHGCDDVDRQGHAGASTSSTGASRPRRGGYTVSLALLLACAFAHEARPCLDARRGHSPEGLMRACWNARRLPQRGSRSAALHAGAGCRHARRGAGRRTTSFDVDVAFGVRVRRSDVRRTSNDSISLQPLVEDQRRDRARHQLDQDDHRQPVNVQSRSRRELGDRDDHARDRRGEQQDDAGMEQERAPTPARRSPATAPGRPRGTRAGDHAGAQHEADRIAPASSAARRCRDRRSSSAPHEHHRRRR